MGILVCGSCRKNKPRGGCEEFFLASGHRDLFSKSGRNLERGKARTTKNLEILLFISKKVYSRLRAAWGPGSWVRFSKHFHLFTVLNLKRPGRMNQMTKPVPGISRVGRHSQDLWRDEEDGLMLDWRVK